VIEIEEGMQMRRKQPVFAVILYSPDGPRADILPILHRTELINTCSRV
jgi:hypothetical protein